MHIVIYNLLRKHDHSVYANVHHSVDRCIGLGLCFCTTICT